MRQMRPINDVVYTNPDFARRIVEHFSPTGLCLDPCRGKGAFYDAMPEPRDWCEISEGKDFLDYNQKVDWIITNPPWSTQAYRAVSQHAFDVADNVVFLVRLHNALGTFARLNDARYRRHYLKEIVVCDWEEAGLPVEGFTLVACHWQKDWCSNQCLIGHHLP